MCVGEKYNRKKKKKHAAVCDIFFQNLFKKHGE